MIKRRFGNMQIIIYSIGHSHNKGLNIELTRLFRKRKLVEKKRPRVRGLLEKT